MGLKIFIGVAITVVVEPVAFFGGVRVDPVVGVVAVTGDFDGAFWRFAGFDDIGIGSNPVGIGIGVEPLRIERVVVDFVVAVVVESITELLCSRIAL